MQFVVPVFLPCDCVLDAEPEAMMRIVDVDLGAML